MYQVLARSYVNCRRSKPETKPLQKFSKGHNSNKIWWTVISIVICCSTSLFNYILSFSLMDCKLLEELSWNKKFTEGCWTPRGSTWFDCFPKGRIKRPHFVNMLQERKETSVSKTIEWRKKYQLITCWYVSMNWLSPSGSWWFTGCFPTDLPKTALAFPYY